MFDISASPNLYYDLKRSTLRVKSKILKDDGSVPNSKTKDKDGNALTVDNVAPTNFLLHSLWSQLEIALQQKTITKIGDNHAHKAYIDALLSTSATQKNTGMMSQMFVKDTPGTLDETTPNGSNEGLYDRYHYTKDGQSVFMEGPLYDDLAEQDRYVLNGVPISISLWPNSSAFSLMADKEGYKVVVEDVAVNMCCVEVDPGMLQAHNRMLKDSPALYPLEMSDIKTYNVPQGQQSLFVNDVYQGKVPDQLVVGMVSSEAYSGSYKKSPWNFQHFNLTSAGFYVDGKSVPSSPIETNFESGDVVQGYGSLLNLRQDLGITLAEYQKGYTLLAYNLKSGLITHGPQKGSTRLELKFARPLPEAVTVIVYAKFPTVVEIDQARAVRVQA